MRMRVGGSSAGLCQCLCCWILLHCLGTCLMVFLASVAFLCAI